MIRINTKEVLRNAEEAKQTSPPKIVIRVIGTLPEPSIAETMKKAVIHQIQEGTRSDLLTSVWSEFNALEIERKKLSNQTAAMVDRGATIPELKAHYEKIDSMLAEGAELFDRARYVEQHGHLPQPMPVDVDLLLLKDQRKKLVDLRCKLSRKLEKKTAKNPNRINEWQLDLDKAQAEYLLVDNRIKKLEGKA